MAGSWLAACRLCAAGAQLRYPWLLASRDYCTPAAYSQIVFVLCASCAQAIYLLTTGAREAAFRNIKTIAECLADELVNAAKGSSNRWAPAY